MNKLYFFPPPVIVLLLIAAAHAANRSFPHMEIIPATSGGLVWLASGLALAMSAMWQFRALKTTALPFGKPTQFVTGGVYLWTRNPMYLGLLTALIGLAFYMGTLPFWLLPPAFFLIINRFHIPYEESRLTNIFGTDYVRYRQSVHRWL
ncbi:MAG: methyltransferase family protein [Methylococcaceae bacterium]